MRPIIGIRRKLALAFALMALVIGALAIGTVHFQDDIAKTAALLEAKNVANSIAYTGAVNVIARPEFLQPYVEGLRSLYNRDVVIVDAQKRGVADANKSEIGKTYTHDPENEVGLTIGDGQIRTFVETNTLHPKGAEQIVVPLRYDQANPESPIIGAVILEYTKIHEDLLAEVRVDMYENLIFCFACILFAGGFGIHIASRIAKPLEDLEQGVRAIAAGNYDTAVRIRSNDEVGILGDAFNKMAAQLKRNSIEIAQSGKHLRESEERFRRYFDIGLMGMAISDPAKGLIEVNDKFCEILGYERQELLRLDWASLTHPDDLQADLAQFNRVLAGKLDGYSIEKRFLRKDGRVIHSNIAVRCVRRADGSPDYFLGLIEDITERKQAEGQLEHLAHHDALTGLPNRALCYDRLSQALVQAERQHWGAAVLFLDLDRFKTVNDTLGHTTGDALLREAAQRLKACVRGADTVARVGGDEFVVILAELADPEDAGLVARKIIDAMALPLQIDAHEVFITASIGIATYPADGRESETLVKNADAAMFQAKDHGRGSFQFYTSAMNERALEKLMLENDLRRALERNEFTLHYQPKLNLVTGKVTSFEALIRWNRAAKGMVQPVHFIPVLEDSGLIVPVGEWVIRAACAQMRAWQDAGLEIVPVAVNLAVKQFLHHDIVAVIESALRQSRIDARMLEVEITESDVMQNPEAVIMTLRTLRERRIRVSIDDFGTGYSSLGYLKRLPVDTIKLDRSFVTGLPQDGYDVSIARAVIGMAHSLDLKVVAEGVETEAQRNFLSYHGCDEMQGYLFSRPLPAVECSRFLQPAGRPAAAVG
jgi:diguanylate cyclase (GGDEF)-like protein/PAS domain S-box-containing protein